MGDLGTRQTGIALLSDSASPTTLTAGYGSARSGRLTISKARYVELGVNYTMGGSESGNSIQLKYEVSFDGSVWYRVQEEAVSSGTVTRHNREDTFSAASAAATYDRFSVSFENYGGWEYLKVSVKETGIASNGGSCWIEASVWGR